MKKYIVNWIYANPTSDHSDHLEFFQSKELNLAKLRNKIQLYLDSRQGSKVRIFEVTCFEDITCEDI